MHGSPQIGVVALLAKAGANGGALLLHDGALVGDGLGGPHVADELLDCSNRQLAVPQHSSIVCILTGAHPAASKSSIVDRSLSDLQGCCPMIRMQLISFSSEAPTTN